ncbi:MAG: hypothetical protein HKN01_02775, partial [Acidimicrobiia bacterium]|nr:hypothetical protein [Acidimicrobiia bacterium]
NKGWQAWTSAGLVILVGVVFVFSVFSNNLFEVGPAFEDLIDDFRPILTDEALATAEADVAGLGAVATEFETAVVPGMAQALQMTPEEFGGMMQQQFPAVATGAAALPAIETQFSSVLGTLKAEQDRFASADAIPTEDLPATTVPWGLFIAGIATILVGGYMLYRIRMGSMVAIGLGVALVVVPLLLSLVGKAADADELNENLEPVYTQELVDGAKGALEVVGAMGTEMQTAMLPTLATQLQFTPDQLNAFLGENFPATAGVLSNLDEVSGRFNGLVTTFDENLDNYEVLKPVAFTPIIWTIIIGGLALIAFGAWGFIDSRKT